MRAFRPLLPSDTLLPCMAAMAATLVEKPCRHGPGIAAHAEIGPATAADAPRRDGQRALRLAETLRRHRHGWRKAAAP